jgi:hypothetical protein
MDDKLRSSLVMIKDGPWFSPTQAIWSRLQVDPEIDKDALSGLTPFIEKIFDSATKTRRLTRPTSNGLHLSERGRPARKPLNDSDKAVFR